MNDGFKVYSQGKLTFVVADDKVVVITSLGQAFYLQPKAHYWTRRLRLIKVMVELNEIRTLNELASWTNPGISWEATSKDYRLALASH